MRLRSGSSLQAKITLSLLGVVVLASLGSWLIGGNLIDRYIVQQAHENVAKSVEMFEGLYAEKLYVKHRLLGSLASFSAFQEDVARANRPAIEKVLRDLRRGSQFDILNVTDATGRVLVRSTHPSRHGDAVANDPYVRKAILSREPCFGFDIMDRAALLREGRALAERASIEVVPTERSREPGKKLETRGLFLKAASPVLREGKLVGVVYGALLLNRDTEIPDRAKHLVFGDEKVGGREIGSATLFMDDLRISTN
ncbi:MAG: hypothetical protein NDJ90_04995, partial [Oligoflexia bacterium]|nr:hypothetical protein [Oligoflexia bacterium]